MPLLAGLAVGIVIVGGAIAYFTKSSGPRIQTISCQSALKLLEEDPNIQLIDIRLKEDFRETGSPDLRSVRKSPVNAAYKPTVQASQAGIQSTIAIGWAERLCRNSKVQQDLPVILLDADGSTAGAAARDLAAAAEDRPVLYIISGGASAWLAQDLPWRQPLKLGINLDTIKAIDISGVTAGTEKLVEKYKENPTVVNGGIAIVAVAGASILLVSEAETILQVVGSVFALQFLAKRFLFAEDRERTFRDVQLLFTEKIAAGQAGDDIKRLAEKVLDATAEKAVTDDTAVAMKDASGGAEEGSSWTKAWQQAQGLQGDVSAVPPSSKGGDSAAPAASKVIESRSASWVPTKASSSAPPGPSVAAADGGEQASSTWNKAWQQAQGLQGDVSAAPAPAQAEDSDSAPPASAVAAADGGAQASTTWDKAWQQAQGLQGDVSAVPPSSKGGDSAAPAASKVIESRSASWVPAKASSSAPPGPSVAAADGGEQASSTWNKAWKQLQELAGKGSAARAPPSSDGGDPAAAIPVKTSARASASLAPAKPAASGSPTPTPFRTAASASAAPAPAVAAGSNIEEAAAWIEAWQQKQGAAAGAENGASTGATEPENVAEAREWIQKFRARQS